MTDSTFGPLRPLWAHIKIYIVQTRKPGICGSVLARLWGEDAPFVELLELSKEKNNDRKKVHNNIRAFGFCFDVGGACSIELRNAQTRSQYFTRFLVVVLQQPADGQERQWHSLPDRDPAHQRIHGDCSFHPHPKSAQRH